MSANINRKKARLYNSRNIKAQTTDSSIENKGEKLSIPNFLETRKFEIKSFELSQLNSKNALSTRIFQSLPRTLRRRAASHNVKRIPKRLRTRALREMNSTGPIKKLPRGRKLYKLQVKTRLLKVAGKLKEMKQIPESNSNLNIRKQYKLLSKQLKEISSTAPPKLNNTVGSRDIVGVNKLTNPPSGNIKYFKRQRDFVWLPTHIWHAKRFKMIKKHEYQIPYTPTQKCFKSMSRQGRNKAIVFDTSYYGTMIVELDSEQQYKQTMYDLIKTKSNRVISGEKSYYGWIYIDSQPICQGYVLGNTSRQIIIRVYPSVYKQLFNHITSQNLSVQDCRYALGSIELSGPSGLSSLSKILQFNSQDNLELWKQLISVQDTDLIPIGTTFTFDIQDPRIYKTPRKLNKSNNVNVYDLIISLSSKKLVDPEIVNQLCQSESRNNSYKDQLSNKDLGRFHVNLHSKPQDISTSHIPVIISKLTNSKWTIILPWYWVLPFWLQLVKVRDVKPGGYLQINQMNFENQQPSFPQDFPWIKDGWINNEIVGQASLFKAKKLPKSQVKLHDSEFKMSIFDAYKCDWHSLRNLIHIQHLRDLPKDLNSLKNTVNYASFDNTTRKITSTHDMIQIVRSLIQEIEDDYDPVVELYNTSNPSHVQFHKNEYTIDTIPMIVRTKLPIIPVKITLLNEGTITNNARIYIKQEETSDFNVIGFVTTGGINLRQGVFIGIGAIVAQAKFTNIKQVYIRNVGQSKLYLAKLDLI
ncbi:Ribonucleases P/MRP protein subunit POP1 [Spathaspora sp. JA1]|nr:Ribonucleases P/MRP protein subunit POP1 [Spathaspora sp. JA1]